jgi:hypothetical protein
MIWLQFLLSSAVVVYAAIKLAEYGDIIAVRTRLGGLFVGTIFPGRGYFPARTHCLDQRLPGRAILTWPRATFLAATWSI